MGRSPPSVARNLYKRLLLDGKELGLALLEQVANLGGKSGIDGGSRMGCYVSFGPSIPMVVLSDQRREIC